MAIFYDAPVTPDDLTAFVREVPLPADDVLLGDGGLFGPPELSDSNQFDWSEVLATNRTARFRSFDGRIHVSDRDGGSDKRVNFLPLSDSLNMGEYERLQLEFARTGGTRQEALSRAIYNDGERLTRHVQNRMRQAVGDVLTDGKLTINENGFQGEADFGVPAAHLVTADTPWNGADGTKLTDLSNWRDVYVDTNGFAPASMLMSRRNLRSLLVDTEMIGAAVGTVSGKTRINRDELRDLLDAEDLPPTIYVYDSVVDVDGTATRVIPEDRVLFLPPNPRDMLRVRYGISATALELVESNRADLAFEEAAGITGVVIKGGPPFRQYTFVDAVGMPVLADAKRLLVAKVR